MFFSQSADGKRYRMTPIDLGATGALDVNHRTAAAIFGIGLKYEDPVKMIEGLEMISQHKTASAAYVNGLSDSQKAHLLREISLVYQDIPANMPDYMKTKKITTEIGNLLDKHRVELADDSFIQFYRGSAFLELEVENINRQISMAQRLDPDFKVAQIDLKSIHNAVSTKAANLLVQGTSGISQLAGTAFNYATSKTKRWAEINETFRNMEPQAYKAKVEARDFDFATFKRNRFRFR